MGRVERVLMSGLRAYRYSVGGAGWQVHVSVRLGVSMVIKSKKKKSMHNYTCSGNEWTFAVRAR